MDLANALLMIPLGFWLTLPAFLPNSAAVLFGGGTPVDFGKTWRGRRLLGDGKTWRGLLGGICAGTSLGFAQILVAFPFDEVDFWGFGPCPRSMAIVASLAIGSLLGDMVGAFIKRRLGLERGAKAPVLDQYNFLVGAMLLTFALFPDWFIGAFIEGEHIISLIAVIVITPILHRSVNIIGHRLGFKHVPW